MKLPLNLTVSPLAHTWLIDLDGTIFEHNSHLLGEERLLPGVTEFWATIPSDDTIVLLSARRHEYANATLAFLKKHGLRYNYALFDMPTGERILINDRKPSGLETAIALNIDRNQGLSCVGLVIDSTL